MSKRTNYADQNAFSPDETFGVARTPAGKKARRRTRKPQVPMWEPSAEQLARWAEEARMREVAAEIRAAKERKLWVNHQQQLIELGRSMPEGSGRAHFTHLGCVAAIMAEIERNEPLRDDILINVQRRHRYSYRHIGYVLTKLTGTDPSQHIWLKDEDRRYRLLGQSSASAI